jgi:hypothetical protein
MPSPRWLVTPLIVASLALAGCVALERNNRLCALVVTVDDGRRLASPEEMAKLERKLTPVLAERGLVLTRESRDARMVAMVEFSNDPLDPTDIQYVIRDIHLNPLRTTAAATNLDYRDRVQEQLRSDHARDVQ